MKTLLKNNLAKILRKNMTLGASYNIFDGEELLPYSIRTIRKNVHHISVVYQTTSNFGNPANPDLKENLERLKKEGLVNELYLYEPNLEISAQQNEKNKRDIGLKLAKKGRCNYFLSMDADEFYDENQFNEALNYIILNNIKMSAVGIIEYLKSPENQIVGGYTFIPKGAELYNFYVPFVIKISQFKKQRHGKNYFPCYTDPTRKLSHAGRFKLFSLQEIAMHHMSTIRLDINKKYDNTSAIGAAKENQKHLKEIQKEILEFDFEKSKILPENCTIFKQNIVRKVLNKFKIEL